MNKKLTYRKLAELLKTLGYSQRSISWNGTPQWVFEHKDLDRATIYIAEQPLDEPVHQFHLGSVIATLKAHEIIKDDPVLLLEAAAASAKKSKGKGRDD